MQSRFGFAENNSEEQRKLYATIDTLTSMSEDASGNEFIRRLVQVIIDEWRVIGNGEFMKANHKQFLYFKYPEELEVSSNM